MLGAGRIWSCSSLEHGRFAVPWAKLWNASLQNWGTCQVGLSNRTVHWFFIMPSLVVKTSRILQTRLRQQDLVIPVCVTRGEHTGLSKNAVEFSIWEEIFPAQIHGYMKTIKTGHSRILLPFPLYKNFLNYYLNDCEKKPFKSFYSPSHFPPKQGKPDNSNRAGWQSSTRACLWKSGKHTLSSEQLQECSFSPWTGTTMC